MHPRIQALLDWSKKKWTNPKEKNYLKWTARVFWAGAVISVLFSLLIFVFISHSDLPGFEELENPQYDLASLIYDRNGKVFGKYYVENREFVDFEDISPNILDALISVEDERFYRHAGIDFRALLRVAFKSVLLGQESSGGGSTISQQLAKLLFQRQSLAGKSKVNRALTLMNIKFKEWITAVKLERSYTKEEIVSMYLSKFEFINGAHGIESAANIYFDKEQKDLNIQEAATLVGMLKNPARFNPVRFNDRTRERRNVVISMMADKHGYREEIKDSLLATPLDISRFKRSSQSEGLAPYFRSELTKWLRSLLVGQEYRKPDGTTYDIYRDGLNIYTTIDERYQVHAENAVFEHLANLQERYWTVWKYKNPLTFEADEDYIVELREESINRRIRESDLYQSRYEKYFGNWISFVSENFSLDLREPTLRRIMKDRSYIESITGETNQKYQRLVNSEHWSGIRDSWREFQEELEELFDEEVDAEVFAYNDDFKEVKRMTRRDSVIYHIRHLQSGLLSVDPLSGEILAWVGGPNHQFFKYDHVTMRRQVGSTIKPFVYATAIGVQGLSPCQEYSDVQYTIAPGDADFQLDQEWSPSNANGLFTGNSYNLYQGLLYSKNSITVRILKELGTVEPIRDLLHNVGIDKYERLNGERLVVPEVPSICLGSMDLSLLEMTGGYTTFANDGVYTQPYFVDRIEDKNGKLIYQSSTLKRRALNPLYNAVMVDMLRNNTGGGFGMGLKSDNGGKTGTTNDYADGWFMGITPRLVTGIWVGGDEKWVRFYTLDDGQGFVMARPIYQNYMKKVEEDESIAFDVTAAFAVPPPGYRDLVDCSRYKQGDPEEEQEMRIRERVNLDEFDEDEFEDEFEVDFPETTAPRDTLN
jgi:penicillin-binding protein 1A